jgi:hypothetical protein
MITSKQRSYSMKAPSRSKTLIDLKKLNTLGAEGCPACGRKFELGEAVVLACGNWEGQKYIHEDEATFDKETNSYYERRYYKGMKENSG